MFSGIVSVLPWKDHFIQFILQIVVLIFHAENLIKKNKKITKVQNKITINIKITLLLWYINYYLSIVQI